VCREGEKGGCEKEEEGEWREWEALRPAVVDQLPVVLVLLGIQDKVAATARGARV